MKDTKGLWPSRIEADEQYLEDHLFSLEGMIRAAGGPHYSRSSGPGTYTPENHYHSYTTLMVARLMHDNPRVRCTTRRPGSQMEAAEAIRHGLNRWVRDVNLREVGQLLAYDFSYMWGMAMVRQSPNRHMGKTTERWIWDDDGSVRVEKPTSLWPAVYRIPQHQVIIDTQALTTNEAEYMGHLWYQEAKSIMAEAKADSEAGWNIGALEGLLGSAGTQGGSASKSDPDRKARSMDPKKHEIEFLTLWVPGNQVDEEHGPDKGYHGALLTYARNSSTSGGRFAEVKKPEPYYGPPSGPYQLFGAYRLPNKLLPLSPLVAVEGQIRELNRQARALSRSSERHKRVILFDEKHKKTALKLKSAQHDFFVGIPGFDKAKFAEVEVGGATDSQYKAVAYHHDRLNRISAMDEAQAGNVTGVGTATEHTIANEASSTRVNFLKQQFSESMSQVLRKVAWFLYHDDRVVFPLGEEAAEDLLMDEPWFHGGTHDKDSDANFDDLELEIEAYSMQRADEAAVRAQTQEGIFWLLQTAPMRAQLPFLDWDRVDTLAAQVFGMPDLAGLVDNQAALEMGPFEEGGADKQPRLSRDVGSAKNWGASFAGARPTAQGPPTPMMQAGAMPGGNAGLGPEMGV